MSEFETKSFIQPLELKTNQQVGYVYEKAAGQTQKTQMSSMGNLKMFGGGTHLLGGIQRL